MAGDTLAYVANYHPLVGHLIQQTGMVPILTAMLDDPHQEYGVDAGTVVAGLIHNILSSERIRLYRLSSFWHDKALPLFFPWCPSLSPEAINEDRAGRMLDALHRAGPQKVFSAVMRQVIVQYALDIGHIHYDTTSKSFYGVYAHQTAEQGPQLARGHSKDHRPDLVQLLFGVVMSRDGVLVSGEVASGNEQDMKLNGYWITHIRQHLGLDIGQFLLYVADSAAVTEENLHLFRLFHIDLISRLPKRFGLAERLFVQALATQEPWTEVGTIGQGKRASQYEVWETTAELAGERYRFLVVRSDSLTARQTKTLERAIAREQTSTQKEMKEVTKQQWDTPSDAEQAQTHFDQTHKLRYHQMVWTVVPQIEYLPRTKPGRPRKDEVRPTVTRYQLQGVLQPDEEAIQAARARCGLFILITSLMDDTICPAATILAEYKEQHLPERMNSFLKSPIAIGAFCLKKPERIIALGYVLLMAAMIHTLLERQVRKALKKITEPPVQGLDRRLTRRPTTWAIFTVLSAILIIAQPIGDTWHFRPARPLSDNQSRILTLAGFGPEIYSWQGRLAPENLGLPPP